MAKQRGLLKIHGTLEDLTFYKTQDGHLVKTKGGVSGTRIASEATFQRTRENNSEFGSSAAAGKLMRDTLRNLMSQASDNRVVARLTQTMTQIKNYDTTSLRGERVVGNGITTAEGKSLLKGFNFNIKALLGSILYRPITVDTGTGNFSIAQLIPLQDIKAPQGCTHISIKAAWANIDFASGLTGLNVAAGQNFPWDMTPIDINQDVPAPGVNSGVSLFMILIEFFQEVNGAQYSLKNGMYNTLNIIEIL